MAKFFLIGVFSYMVILAFKLILILVLSTYYKEDYKEHIDFNYKWLLVELLLSGGLTYMFSVLSATNVNYILISIFLIALIPTYAFLVTPLYYLYLTKKYVTDERLTKIVVDGKLDYNIRLINAKVSNAYATGILPFSKTILIGKPVSDSLSDDQLKSIIYHEIGHLKNNHLEKLYLLSVIIVSLSYFIFLIRSRISFLNNEYIDVLSVGICGALLGLLIWYVPGKIQYRFEFSADLFAAKMNGKHNLIDALNRLDTLSDGEVSKGGLTHPTLEKRIKNLHNES